MVGTYEGVCPSSTFSALPDTPRLAGAYEYGILDGNLGQMVSFQSTYKSTLRIEVPVWPEVQQGVLTANKAKRHPGSPKITPPFPPLETTSREQCQVHTPKQTRLLCLKVQGTLRMRRRRKRMIPMCRRRDKVASPSDKASCSEQRILMRRGVTAISMK